MFYEESALFVVIYLMKTGLCNTLCLNVGLGAGQIGQEPESYLLARTETSEDLTDCASACGLNWACVSFFYHLSTKECRHHSGLMSALNMNPMSGWTGYEVAGRPISEAYSMCTAADGYIFHIDSHMCYKVHEDKKTGLNARSQCHSEGAELVMLNTDAKKAVIESIVLQDGGNEYFIGAMDDLVEGEWRWLIDGSLITWFTKIEQGSECFEIEASLVYDDTGCDNQLQKFFCEIQLI